MHASTSSVSSPAPHSLDTSPFLTRSIADHILRSRRFLRRPPQPFRGAAARLLGRSSSRRMTLQEPSVSMRVNAESDWAFSKPIIVLDVLWNLAFVVIAVVLLGLSVKEEPEVPLRLWIIGYGLQCVFHIACVIFQYRRRPSGRSVGFGGNGDSTSVLGSDGGDSVGYGAEQRASDDETSTAKHLESANTIFSFIWWIVGFYWVTAGGQNLPRDSPQLYWLCIFFLAFDVISVFICAAVACLIGFALCCCLPCIVGILCSMTDQEGATTDEIDQLPKYRFRRILDFEKIDGEIQVSTGGTMTECEFDMPTELLLSHEDANCCICLSAYEDGTELRDLPCHHHFHRACIDKWLYINAICPLCKFNILRATNQIGNEEV